MYFRLKTPSADGLQLMYSKLSYVRTTMTQTLSNLPQNICPPQVMPGRKKKPYVGLREGSSKKRKWKSLRQILSPENGPLVQSLIPVAYHVLEAREIFIRGICELMKVIPVKACRCCSEIHVGHIGHHIKTCEGPNNGPRNGRHDWVDAKFDKIIVPVKSYHLNDRLARPVEHDKRFYYKRLSSVVELCIQAGVDVPKYPTRRSHRIGAILPTIQETREISKQASQKKVQGTDEESELNNVHCTYTKYEEGTENSLFPKFEELSNCQCYERKKTSDHVGLQHVGKSIQEYNAEQVTKVSNDLEALHITAERTLEAWTKMRIGVRKLTKKYSVKVCGYCPEVHVGPIGHKVRLCKAYKHQMRGGHHGWQQAALHDIMPHEYVWHVPDVNAPPLAHELRKYYGQVPAVVELCVQAGAKVPDLWRPYMRLDVVIPDLDECGMVA